MWLPVVPTTSCDSASPSQAVADVAELIHAVLVQATVEWVCARERGADWCRALRQAFTGDAVRSYAELVEAVVRRYFARWDAGGEMKAYVQCKDLAFDVACAILLGMQLDVRAPPARTPPARPVPLSARFTLWSGAWLLMKALLTFTKALCNLPQALLLLEDKHQSDTVPRAGNLTPRLWC